MEGGGGGGGGVEAMAHLKKGLVWLLRWYRGSVDLENTINKTITCVGMKGNEKANRERVLFKGVMGDGRGCNKQRKREQSLNRLWVKEGRLHQYLL